MGRWDDGTLGHTYFLIVTLLQSYIVTTPQIEPKNLAVSDFIRTFALLIRIG